MGAAGRAVRWVARFAAHAVLLAFGGLLAMSLGRLVLSGPQAVDVLFWFGRWQNAAVLLGGGLGAELLRRSVIKIGEAARQARTQPPGGTGTCR
jgi:hypothetical protein